MKKIILGMLIASIACAANAQKQVQVDGHVRKDGTYVPPHTRTAPNSTRTDNWDSKGNVNPNTGKQGTQDPYSPPKPRNPWGN